MIRSVIPIGSDKSHRSLKEAMELSPESAPFVYRRSGHVRSSALTAQCFLLVTIASRQLNEPLVGSNKTSHLN